VPHLATPRLEKKLAHGGLWWRLGCRRRPHARVAAPRGRGRLVGLGCGYGRCCRKRRVRPPRRRLGQRCRQRHCRLCCGCCYSRCCCGWYGLPSALGRRRGGLHRGGLDPLATHAPWVRQLRPRCNCRSSRHNDRGRRRRSCSSSGGAGHRQRRKRRHGHAQAAATAVLVRALFIRHSRPY
jgi:hypothetical protein